MNRYLFIKYFELFALENERKPGIKVKAKGLLDFREYSKIGYGDSIKTSNRKIRKYHHFSFSPARKINLNSSYDYGDIYKD